MKEGNRTMRYVQFVCIDDYMRENEVLCRKGTAYDVTGYNKIRKVYRIGSARNAIMVTSDELSKHFKRIPQCIRVEFYATFETDGDFHFDVKNLKELRNIPLYDGAAIDYKQESNDYDVDHFHLVAEGPFSSCRRALKDLIEEMMVSIRVGARHHYIVKRVYELLEVFHDAASSYEGVEMSEYMGGNYDGTEITLKITEIERENEPALEDLVDQIGWIEVSNQSNPIDPTLGICGDNNGTMLKCANCDALHYDHPYVRSFKHCPSCGEVV